MFFSFSSGATSPASVPPLMTMLHLRAIGERDGIADVLLPRHAS